MLRVAALVAISFGSLMPIAAIIILYNVSSMPIRLGLVAVFTVSFTFLCGCFTNAKTIEIFAATSAYVSEYDRRVHKLTSVPDLLPFK